jgi:hypothetical protein
MRLVFEKDNPSDDNSPFVQLLCEFHKRGACSSNDKVPRYIVACFKERTSLHADIPPSRCLVLSAKRP